MGIGVCKVSVQSGDRAAVLDVLGLYETGARLASDDLPPRGGLWAVSTTPDGWIHIVGDFWRADDWRLRDLSAHGLVVVSSVEEHVMVSDAKAYAGGAELWFVAHDPENDPEHDPQHLEARGELPPAFSGIRDHYLALSGGEDDDVDHIIEVPLELAKAVCGLRPDFMIEADSPEMVFQVVKRNPEALAVARAANRPSRPVVQAEPVVRSASAKSTMPFWSRLTLGWRRGWSAYRRARTESRARARHDDW